MKFSFLILFSNFSVSLEVDVSIVGKEDEEVLRLQQEKLKNEQKTKSPPVKNRGRPRRPEPAKITRASAAAASTVAVTSKY